MEEIAFDIWRTVTFDVVTEMWKTGKNRQVLRGQSRHIKHKSLG